MLHKRANMIPLDCFVTHWIDLSIFPLKRLVMTHKSWLISKTNLDWTPWWKIDPRPYLKCGCIWVIWECYQVVLFLGKFASNTDANRPVKQPLVWLWLHFSGINGPVQAIDRRKGQCSPDLNQFAHIATQNKPISCSKTVKVSSLQTGKCSSILPKSWANLFNSRPGGLILKNLIGDLRRPARAISWTFRVAIITSW